MDYPILNDPNYMPHRLINDVGFFLKVNSMQAIARELSFDAGQLSRVRAKKEVISERLLIRILDKTGWTLQYVRERAGLPAGHNLL